MMMQFTYLQNNKLEGEIRILCSCNLLYMMTQYAYLRNNKLKEDKFGRFERLYGQKPLCDRVLLQGAINLLP
jgi:hypothetical protein